MIWFWEVVGNAVGANELESDARHQSRLITTVSNGDGGAKTGV